MGFFCRRPLFCFALSFYISACILYSCDRVTGTALSAIALIFSAIAVLATAKIARLKLYRTAAISFSLGIAISAAFSAYNTGIVYDRIVRLAGENDTITGVVERVGYTASYGGYYTVGVLSSECGLAGKRILLSADDGEICLGDTVSCSVVLTSLEEQDFAGALDAKRTYLPDGVVLCAENTSPVRQVNGSATLASALGVMRSKISGIITAGAGTDSGGFLSALFLGDTSFLPATVKRDFRALGISHLLALSGTHLTVLFSLLSKVVKSRFRGIVRFVFTALPVLFYMALTGFSPSVTRAGIMFILAGGGLALRGFDGFTGLGVAVLLICAKNPWAPYDIGLLLSASAMLALLTIGRAETLRHKEGTPIRRFGRRVRAAIFVPLAMLPLMWVLFGEASIVSAPANLVLAPIIAILIPLALVIVAVYPLSRLFVPCAQVIGDGVSAVLSIISAIAKRFGVIISLSGAAAGIVCVSLSVVAAACITLGRKRLRVSICSAVLIVSVTLSVQTFSMGGGELRAELLSAGRNDAVLAEADGGWILFDVGNGSVGVLKRVLRETDGVCARLDSLVLTHTHKRHVSAVTAICEAFFVDKVYLPEPESHDEALVIAQISDAVSRAGGTAVQYRRGDIIEACGLSFCVRRPEYLSRSTHPVVGFSIAYDGGELIYVGSSLCEVCDISKVGDGDAVIFGGHGPIAKSPVCMVNAASVMTHSAAADIEKIPDTGICSMICDSVSFRFGVGGSTLYLRN